MTVILGLILVVANRLGGRLPGQRVRFSEKGNAMGLKFPVGALDHGTSVCHEWPNKKDKHIAARRKSRGPPLMTHGLSLGVSHNQHQHDKGEGPEDAALHL